jgi:hypothetical protein
MYSWTFGIQDSTAGTLNTMTQNMKTVLGMATAARESVASVGASIKDAPSVPIDKGGGNAAVGQNVAVNIDTTAVKTAKERITEIVGAALNVQRAFDYAQKPLEKLPERWQNIRGEIVNTAVALQKGDWSVAGASIATGIEQAMGSVNDFRTSWQFVKEGFTGAKTIFSETWGLFSQNAGTALSLVKTMGLTFLTETLPAVLTFVGQGVVGILGYIGSLMGATGAQAALNAVMLANPIGLIVVGIVSVGAAVYGLITYWEDVKGWLVDFTSFFIKNNPFSWIFDVVGVLFPNFKTAVSDTFKSVFGWIDTYFIQPISKVMSWLGEQISGITNDVQDALKGTTQGAFFNLPKTEVAALVETDMPKSLGADARKAGRNKANDVKVGKVQNIEGGGNIKNINIRIDKLVEKIENNFGSGNDMDARKIKEIVTLALIDATNDFNRQ